ncbi:hypothetical protein Ddye_013642 [Dipteronia dyeriana]|uniref:DUF4005 domain-containing protein n=1 Tax=Dipteronia dyeriana TaxID=168575 RepID=A0AAE0CJU7_9ROSI|nr:hypothetical protein Ddye_013642 [Dipteronia dyeriana]
MGLFRRLFGAKKTASTSSSSSPSSVAAGKERKRWSFTRSSNNTTMAAAQSPSRHGKRGAPFDGSLDPNKHAIAVAAATAAVAEAALAAAHAAAEVVRLTSVGGRAGASHILHQRRAEELVVAAVVKIQSAFRGYLARRALKALKALVKLQALVRGHIVRKQTANMLKRMQTLVKLQAQARASRGHVTESLHSSSKSSLSRIAVPGSPDKAEHRIRAHSTKFDGPSILKRCGSNRNFRDVVELDKARLGPNWLDQWMEENIWNNHRVKSGHADDEKTDKILEVDTWKPHLNSQLHSRTCRSSHNSSAFDYNYNSFMTIDSPSKLSVKSLNPIPSVSSGEVLPLSSIKFPAGKGEAALRTADNSPQVHSASYNRSGSSARRGPFTPTKSEYSWGFFGGYSGHPNYMANTESSRAKVRSHSAPRQRLELERYSSTNRSGQGFWDGGNNNSERDFPLHSGFRTKAYPATDRLRNAQLR